MTASKYFDICEQLGEEPDPEKIPPEMEDFPLDVQSAMLVYGKLGDRIVVDVGYLGKDFTSLPIHMEVEEVSNKEIFLETLLRLDEVPIKESSEAMKREREKLKNKK